MDQPAAYDDISDGSDFMLSKSFYTLINRISKITHRYQDYFEKDISRTFEYLLDPAPSQNDEDNQSSSYEFSYSSSLDGVKERSIAKLIPELYNRYITAFEDQIGNLVSTYLDYIIKILSKLFSKI